MERLTKQNGGFEEIGSPLFVLGITWIANHEVQRQDFRVKGEVGSLKVSSFQTWSLDLPP